MWHWRARRLLLRSLDEQLPVEQQLDLDVHVASCARCRRLRREYALSEALLAQMPVAFAPRELDPRAYARLVSLARWGEGAEWPPPARGRYAPPLLALASAAVIVLLAASVNRWSPVLLPYVEPAHLAASYPPGAGNLAATGSSGRF